MRSGLRQDLMREVGEMIDAGEAEEDEVARDLVTAQNRRRKTEGNG
jgi:hypothetical protein